jgi:hypothetical protein
MAHLVSAKILDGDRHAQASVNFPAGVQPRLPAGRVGKNAPLTVRAKPTLFCRQHASPGVNPMGMAVLPVSCAASLLIENLHTRS